MSIPMVSTVLGKREGNPVMVLVSPSAREDGSAPWTLRILTGFAALFAQCHLPVYGSLGDIPVVQRIVFENFENC